MHTVDLYDVQLREDKVAERVSACELFRLSEKQMPTTEKRRSTVAEDAGQPRYCRAITSRLGNILACLLWRRCGVDAEIGVVCRGRFQNRVLTLEPP